MIEKLKSLSLEKLLELQTALAAVMKEKRRAMLHPGTIATFEKNGQTVGMMIQRINPKTISGYEINLTTGEHFMHRRWKVSPGFLSPYIPPKKVEVPLGVGNDRPAQSAQW